MNHIEAMKEWFEAMLDAEIKGLYMQAIKFLRQDATEVGRQEPAPLVFEVDGKLKEKNT